MEVLANPLERRKSMLDLQHYYAITPILSQNLNFECIKNVDPLKSGTLFDDSIPLLDILFQIDIFQGLPVLCATNNDFSRL